MGLDNSHTTKRSAPVARISHLADEIYTALITITRKETSHFQHYTKIFIVDGQTTTGTHTLPAPGPGPSKFNMSRGGVLIVVSRHVIPYT